MRRTCARRARPSIARAASEHGSSAERQMELTVRDDVVRAPALLERRSEGADGDAVRLVVDRLHTPTVHAPFATADHVSAPPVVVYDVTERTCRSRIRRCSRERRERLRRFRSSSRSRARRRRHSSRSSRGRSRALPDGPWRDVELRRHGVDDPAEAGLDEPLLVSPSFPPDDPSCTLPSAAPPSELEFDPPPDDVVAAGRCGSSLHARIERARTNAPVPTT